MTRLYIVTLLFNFYAEYIMWNAGLVESQTGIKISGRNISNLRYTDYGLPGSSVVKNPPVMQETWIWSLHQEDPLARKWQPTPVFLPGKSHGQRSLVSYSPWGHKELDTTEWLNKVQGQICRIYYSNDRKWRETKELLDEGAMRVKKLALNSPFKKTKIVASSPITSW